ncbi:MAG TPA: methyl-accepting chemotaxis protein, partial [Candidatus Halomonas stercoripullorum]|nr:methyl-accepting chemotaxis protein [Candidatus Halomonas stercoripullorum]
MKIRTKIWMLPLSTAFIFLVGISLSYLVGTNTSAAIDRLRDVDNPYMLEINQIDRHIDAFRTQLQAAAAEGDIDALGLVESLSQQVSQHIQNVSGILGKEALAQQLEDAFAAYQSTAIGATRAMLGVGELGNLIGEMQASQAVLLELVEAEMANAMQATLDRQAEASQGITTALIVNLLTGLVVLLVLGLASYLVINAVWRELGDEPDNLRRAMKRVAEGDLSTELKVKVNDQESLNANVQQMMVTLRRIIGQIRQSTESISVASSQIATGNHDLSVRTETTAANLQRTAAATEQLTVTVGQTADSAHQADQLASSATSAAARGGIIVEQVVTNMSEIEASSQKITEIIGVIDGIAFQTNILALNASVEAARAGEHGRGFAVVASEVQLLAQRSAEAASEIKTLIDNSSEKVISGTKLVQDTGEAMSEIVKGVQQVTDIIGEISAATSEQSSGLTAVNDSVTALDDMTQQNAALVQESATAAASLSDQTETLSRVVAAFRLAQD